MMKNQINVPINEMQLEEDYFKNKCFGTRPDKVLMSIWGVEVFSFLEFADSDGMPGYGRTVKLQLTEEGIEIWEYAYRDGHFGPVDMWGFGKNDLISLLPQSEKDVHRIIDHQFYLGHYYSHLRREDIKTGYRTLLPADDRDSTPCYFVMENKGSCSGDMGSFEDNTRPHGIDIFQFQDGDKAITFALKAHDYFFAKRTITPEYRRKPSRLLPSLNIKNRSVTA